MTMYLSRYLLSALLLVGLVLRFGHAAPRQAVGTYHYSEALYKSMLFYEAQRSGDLSQATQRVTWRASSALDDATTGGASLSGGWYDAGDHVKFGLPMSWSASMLAWSLVEYRSGYDASNTTAFAEENLRWATDYFIKCHTSANELWVQVGDGNADHAYWGRPQDMTMARPAQKVDQSSPGSDIAGQTAATLAAASIVFETSDPTYSATLLTHAKQLFTFGSTYRGKFTGASAFYSSGSDIDDLKWAAAWLYRKTGETQYLTYVEEGEALNGCWVPTSWDENKGNVNVLMARLTGSTTYMTQAESCLDQWMPGGSVTYTPQGLAHRDNWGALRYAANAAAVAFAYVDVLKLHNRDTARQAQYQDFAINQIHYMLGDNTPQRSFVVGFGNNPPKNPHHRGASCPVTGDCGGTLDQNMVLFPSANPQVLHGALVGGPNNLDNYNDARNDYVSNEVATDYNAGFTFALAKLVTLTGPQPPFAPPPPTAGTPPVSSGGSCNMAVPTCSTSDQTIYTDALNNWENWSWPAGSIPNVAATGTVRSGSNSISWVPPADGALYLHAKTAFSTTSYNAIQMWVHGGSTGGQTLKVHLRISGTDDITGTCQELPFSQFGTLQANTWNKFVIPFASFGVSTGVQLSGFDIQESTGNAHGTMYFDDISLTCATIEAAPVDAGSTPQTSISPLHQSPNPAPKSSPPRSSPQSSTGTPPQSSSGTPPQSSQSSGETPSTGQQTPSSSSQQTSPEARDIGGASRFTTGSIVVAVVVLTAAICLLN